MISLSLPEQELFFQRLPALADGGGGGEYWAGHPLLLYNGSPYGMSQYDIQTVKMFLLNNVLFIY